MWISNPHQIAKIICKLIGSLTTFNAGCKNRIMEELTIIELQEKMASGTLTARQIVAAYLERIEQLDRQGPSLNAVLEINPDALVIADSLDSERQEKGPRSQLHGIPVIIKDNIDTHDKMMTTAGSLALQDSIPPQDAFLVKQLRKAGAIILGKANLSEWANFRSTRSSSGWSSRGGQTHNPYALDRNPCGSSSGSAVAVAANLCSVAVGTETDGSIICPAQTNGIVGIKPTVGLISRSGIIPISHSQDTAGPMARTVADATILLGGMTAVDLQDPATAASKNKGLTDYTSYLDPQGLQGARIGVARNFFGFNPDVDAIMENCIEAMKRLGAEIIDPTNIETVEELGDTEMEVLLYELKADLNYYLSQLGSEAPVATLSDIIAFNKKHQDKVMPYFGQERMLAAAEKGSLTDEDYIQALATNHRLSRDEGIDAVLQKHNLDALVASSGGPAWLTDWVNGDNYPGGSSRMAAVAGYPNITVPAGTIFGLPVGISFFSAAYQEPTLIKLAYAFEQGTQVRRPPQFLPTADFSR
ncbi:MAG: amidase [Chloroflexi bacterium]|nr:amidase [Chloroflexota bacterium]